MSVEIWGQLDKSQDDSEKIEAAIARLIAEHEADPDSHLGTGESLEAHRASEIIDHRAGSVLSDKTTMTEHEIYDSFTSIDAWDVVSGTKQQAGYAMQLDKVINVGTEAEAEAAMFFYSSIDFLIKEKIAQFSANFYGTDPNRFYAISFGTYYLSENDGFGLKVVPDGVYLFVDSGGVRTMSSKYSTNPLTRHLWRIHFFPSESVVRVYMDGVLIIEMSIPTNVPVEGDTPMNLYISTALNYSAAIRITNLFFSQEV